MPQSIPAGLTQEHVLRTLSDLDAGMDHPFGQPTGYELAHEGKRYALRAVPTAAVTASEVVPVCRTDEVSGEWFARPCRPSDSANSEVFDCSCNS